MVGRLIGVMTVLAIAVAVSAPPATACNEPDIEVSTTRARPGDWVNFTVSATDAGAGYIVFVQGQEVATGTDPDGGGVSSRFQMPDLGDSDLPAAVEVKVTHPNPGSEGGDFHGGAPWWGSTAEVGYRARTSSPAPAPAPEREKARKSAPRAQPERKRAAVTKRAAPKPQRKRQARKAKRRARQRERRTRAATEADITSTPAAVRSEPEPAEVAKVAPTGIGMKGAVGILFLLTVGCAGYGRYSSRRRMF
jgi:hypothetical protein